ncbi:NYN domain-containing protein [Roseomonas haemaphysalidis]|uniref:NYN domain-containing protein n=1 Tax=Roseomonas haemaphysalidis TaxID=2768162 RepID=UPI001A9632FD|nr:NYN domain-containing protein [Roseomonas haemaphysalidis]
MHLAYVDCSNLFIEAQKVSAVARGMAPSLAAVNHRHASDFAYRLDFHRLMALLREVDDPLRAAAFGSITDANETLWSHAQAAGFDVQVVERGADGREKRVDTGVVTRICRDAYRLADPDRDRITLVAGDGDYEPLVRQLVADRFHVTLLFWAHASRELQQAVSHFHALDPYIAELALGCRDTSGGKDIHRSRGQSCGSAGG